MLANIKKHKDNYLAGLLCGASFVVCYYYIINSLIPTNLVILTLLVTIGIMLGMFLYYYVKWNNTAKELFKTLVKDDDKGLYMRLVNEFGLKLGEYIYYSNKVKYLKYRDSRKRNDLRYLLNK